MAELPKDAIPPMTAWLIQRACKREVSFATLAKSSTSRCAIAGRERHHIRCEDRRVDERGASHRA